MAKPQTPIPPAQKTMQKFEQGRYTATDVRWGMTLDLSGADDRSLIAYGFHGRENQQARAFFFPSAVPVQEKLIVTFAVTPGPGARTGIVAWSYNIAKSTYTVTFTYTVL